MTDHVHSFLDGHDEFDRQADVFGFKELTCLNKDDGHLVEHSKQSS